MIETHPRTFAVLILALILLALSCALFAPPVRAADVHLRARLTNDQGASITWTQGETTGLTCLYHKKGSAPAVLYTCWSDLPTGPIRTFVNPPFDAAQRPKVGTSEYILTQANQITARARIVAPLWLPMMTQAP